MSNTAMTARLKHFLNRRDLEKPDGRALFEYRVTQPEYDDLHDALLGCYPKYTHDCAAFCLYAAEWWRRHGKGLTFDGLLDSLALDVHYTQLYEQIERGLKFWHRPLRIVRGPTRSYRDFVGSLSREGGLPLQMLGAQSSVRRYFRQLLRAQRMGVEIDANQAALAAEELPPAWRHPDIFELAARLVRHVWELRAVVGDSSQPIADLDRLRPDWQQRLPILVDNEVAATLVRGLVEDAQQIATGGRLGLDVQNCLVLRAGQWSIQRVVEPPPRIPERQIWRVIDVDSDAEDKPRRIRLFIDDGEGLQPLAVATQWRTEAPFELAPLVAGSFVTSSVAELAVQAESHGQAFPARLLRGGEALDSSPWVFIADSEQDDSTEWQLIAQGSARVRARKALVAFDPSLEVAPETVERCGVLDTPAGLRTLVQVGGRASFFDRESDQRFEIEVAASEDDAHLYRIDGESFGEELRPPVWLGIPRIIEQPVFGVRREVPARELEWRPKHGGHPWQKLSDDCLGHIELRLRRAGATLFVKSVHIVPPTTSYEVEPSVDGAVLTLSGTKAAHASVTAASGFEAILQPQPRAGEFAWRVRSTDAAPARITIALQWTLGRHLALRLPFPNVGVHFIDRAGRVLPNNATISLDRLSGCRVEAILPVGELEPVLEGVLDQAVDRTREFVRESCFAHKLRRTRARGPTRQYALDLSSLAHEVRLRLASSTELNASVRLEVKVRNSTIRIIVRRFPISMRVDDSRTHVLVLRDKSETFVDPVLERMTVSSIPIEHPDATPVPLPRGPEGWLVEDVDSGPQTRLIYGLDGDRCCARPVIWTSGDSGPAPDSLDHVVTLERAVTIAWKQVRLRAILRVLDTLIVDPTHTEWRCLDLYLRSLRTLPSTTYDVLDVLVQRPSLCVYTLLTSTPKPGFQVVWSALEELSFAWRLVPIRAWIAGFRLWWARMEGMVPTENEAVREALMHSFQTHARNTLAWIEARLRGFTIVGELIERALFNAEPGQYTSGVSHSSGVFRRAMLDTRDDAHMDLYRTHADDHWPDFRAIHELGNRLPDLRPSAVAEIERIGHPVRKSLLSVSYAPIQAAIAAACDLRLTVEQLFAIRQLETFDNTWFDTCYETTLAAAVGILLQRDPEAFR
jgi:hypothetical protein